MEVLGQALNPSCSCNIHNSCWQWGILNLLWLARDQTRTSTGTQASTVGFLTHSRNSSDVLLIPLPSSPAYTSPVITWSHIQAFTHSPSASLSCLRNPSVSPSRPHICSPCLPTPHIWKLHTFSKYTSLSS